MKAFGPLALASLIVSLMASAGHAQTARQLTRKIVPPPANQPAPPPPARPGAAPAQPVAPAPIDPEKERAKQADALKKTIEFQKKRAEDGSASAQYELANRYFFGEGVERDAATGRKWLEKSAAQDYAPAKKKLAELDAAKK
jgi:TPR repeat protein